MAQDMGKVLDKIHQRGFSPRACYRIIEELLKPFEFHSTFSDESNPTDFVEAGNKISKHTHGEQE